MSTVPGVVAMPVASVSQLPMHHMSKSGLDALKSALCTAANEPTKAVANILSIVNA